MRQESETPGPRGGEDILPFERMLADLSAGFVNLPAERVDGAITAALRRIVELLGVDRCNLIRFSADAEPRVTHTWSEAGIPAVVLRFLSSDFPWAMARIRAGDAIVAERLEPPARAGGARD